MSAVEWAVPTFAYGIGWLLAFRRISGQLAWYFYEGGRKAWSRKRDNIVPDGEQWTVAIFLGALYAVVWPLSLPVAHGIAKGRSGAGMFYTPPSQRERLYKLRIAELEREAGIK